MGDFVIASSNGVVLYDETIRRIRASRPFPGWLQSELRSDHAGEVGAVGIYRGALAAGRNDGLRDEIGRHLETERRHLRALELILDPDERSRLLALWRAAGWLLGYVACRLGPETYHRTIVAVETFVDRHYDQQARRLSANGGNEPLLGLLRACQRDEVAHRDDAARRVTAAEGRFSRWWAAIVAGGSAGAVALARRL